MACRMKKRILNLTLVALALAALAIGLTPGLAQHYTRRGDDRGIWLSDVAGQSARIARVQVVSRTPAWRGLPGKSASCGYIYSVKVIDDLKGGDSPFEFFSANGDEFKGRDRDYLVLVYAHTEEERAHAFSAVRPSLSPEQYEQLYCRMNHDYYVQVPFQTVRSFDPLAAKRFGGEWLAPPVREDMTWCITSEHAANPLVYRSISGGRGSYKVLSWASAKSLIQRALAVGSFLDTTC